MLLVGRADEYLIDIAKKYSSTPILVTESNWQDFIKNSNQVGYTGLEEFHNHKNFYKLLQSVDTIEYHPPVTGWPDDNLFDVNSQMLTTRVYLEYFLLVINQTNPKKNINCIYKSDEIKIKSEKFLSLADVRKIDTPQLWGVGCSFMLGVGVEPEERYINLISKKLNMPMSCLAVGGGSISWAADQILRSDIRKDDIIIWGLTSKERYPVFVNDKVIPVAPSLYTKKRFEKWNLGKEFNSLFPEKMFTQTNHFEYVLMTHVHQVINYCDKIGAKLFLFGSLLSPKDFLFLTELPNYYHYPMEIPYIDIGTDPDHHPGPKQHELYADTILKELEKRAWI